MIKSSTGIAQNMLWRTVGLHPDAQTCVENRGDRQYGQSFSKHKHVAPYFIFSLTTNAISKLFAGAVLKCFAQPIAAITLFDCQCMICCGSVMAISRLMFVVCCCVRVRFFICSVKMIGHFSCFLFSSNVFSAFWPAVVKRMF